MYQAGNVLRSTTSSSVYELEQLLGAGAFGEVWKCKELTEDAERAVKIVRTEDAPQVENEVRKQMHACRAIGNDFVPELYEFVESTIHDTAGVFMGNAMAISMAYVDGITLRDVLDQGPMEERTALVVCIDLVFALLRLHEAGIIHRDVKPANILVGRRSGQCWLCDYGIAYDYAQHVPGEAMEICGSPLYMAPEVANTWPTQYDYKADVFSVGVIGYEITQGRTVIYDPEEGPMPTPEEIIEKLRFFTCVRLPEKPKCKNPRRPNFSIWYPDWMRLSIRPFEGLRGTMEDLWHHRWFTCQWDRQELLNRMPGGR